MLKRLLIFFFHHLYHSLAWGYDWVAWTVSLGRWNQWGRSVLDLLPPGLILELGFGPGHLQKSFSQRQMLAIGLDESWQMTRQAARRNPAARLVRAFAESAPFPAGIFQSVVAIFPAPYIFKPQTAREIARLLTHKGTLLILLAARPSGPRISDRLVRALFRITGETPRPDADFSAVISTYQQAGIYASLEWRTIDQSELLYLTGFKE